jgi:hypothetical protein
MNDQIQEYFIKITDGVSHGNDSYTNHCMKIYDILVKMNRPEYVCLAGLFHSIYGTDTFKPTTVPYRTDIIKVIGEQAENLVFKYSRLLNREDCILNNIFNFEMENRFEYL